MSIKVETSNLKASYPEELLEHDKPDFASYNPDMDRIRQVGEKRNDYENIVVIGNGGSITSFRLIAGALGVKDVNLETITTNDPEHIERIEKIVSKENTLIVPVSKSGNTATVIEPLIYFLEKDFEVLAVTSDREGALNQIIEKEDLEYVEHPEVGGRFAGLTENALVPAALCGIDVEKVRGGGEEFYSGQGSEKALQLASALHEAEEDGFDQVFAGFYDHSLHYSLPLLVQLMHETVCKEGKGQTFFGEIGPEFQHHTNQRIFGGERNVMPVLFNVEERSDKQLEVPEKLSGLDLRDRKLGELDGKKLSKLHSSEIDGMKKALEKEGIPAASVELEEISADSIGRFMAFLQYLAYYSALLRNVDPFTQPDVEKSKQEVFESRFE